LILVLAKFCLDLGEVFKPLGHIVHIEDLKLMYLGESTHLFKEEGENVLIRFLLNFLSEVVVELLVDETEIIC
jgi:hypothetical protein